MSPHDLWVALSVEPGTWHRFTFRAGRQFRDREDVDEWNSTYVPALRSDLFDLYAGCARGEFEDVSVSLVPRRMMREEYMGSAGVMWARLETQKQLARLRQFRPVPSLVLREGDSQRRWALWLVEPKLNVVQLERGNKRLAHRLDSRKKHGRADNLMPVPGSILRWGRERRPALVRIEHWSGDVYTPGDVAGRLADAPAPWTPEKAAA